jgi:hypothetical protein
MPSDFTHQGYFCGTCKEFHSGLPISYAADTPDGYAWLKESEREKRAVLGSDQCIIDDDQYFLRGLIELPIIGFNDVFLWGAWVRVWKEDFEEISKHWEIPGRENMIGPYKGRLNNRLSEYPDTLNLKCTIRIQPIGSRPLFYLVEPDDSLAKEQREGISLERIQDIASRLMHKKD